MKKYSYVLGTLLMLGVGSVLWIYYSNDHSECETIKTTTHSDHGEIIVTETHNCKETFNL